MMIYLDLNFIEHFNENNEESSHIHFLKIISLVLGLKDLIGLLGVSIIKFMK